MYLAYNARHTPQQRSPIFRVSLATASVAVALCACSSTELPNKERDPFFRTVTRQLAPEPSYNRLRWGHLPSPIPVSAEQDPSAPLILPVVHFEITKGTLREAAAMLAATTKYGSYTSSSVEGRRISLNMLGTVDEIASEISRKTGISAVIDHNNRQVRLSLIHI